MARRNAPTDTLDLRHPALSATRPLFVDNRDGNTLDAAIARHLAALRRERPMLFEVCVSTGYFNVPGFNLIADELQHVSKVRMLLGAEPLPEARWPLRAPGDPPEPEFSRRVVQDSLTELDRGLERGRDLLPFDEASDRAVRRLLDYLHSGKVEVRRIEDRFLHAKAFVFRVVGGGCLVGSSNLTAAGLCRNLELNLGNYDDAVVNKVEGWFDDLWDLARPYDLAAIYDRLMAEYPPYLIFLRVLWELYGGELLEEIEETQTPGQEIPVTTFQRHGVWRALRIMRRCGGVLVADGVGLGKTYLAGEIIRRYRERRQRVLLVCPAALRDSTWDHFLHEYEFDRAVECVSYEQLARDGQFGGDQHHLHSPIDDYALVVVDEAHNYRNPDSPARAEILRRLLMGQRRDVLMLSATPVNNSLWDLYHLLRYFIKQDAQFADAGVLSLRKRFEDAMHVQPFELNPDLLYPIIDATTVKRTRRFIKRHYDSDMIVVDGQPLPIRFPKPVASSIQYDLEEVLPGFFDDVEEALAPPQGAPRIRMARYQPERYLLAANDGREDSALVGLIRTGLLKRFESSAHAFGKTTAKMVREHELFLEGLERGVVARKELLHELAAADDEEVIEELFATSPHGEPADEYDVEALAAAVETDRAALEEFSRRGASVDPKRDPKLAALVKELARIVEQARNEATDDEDEHRKRKVLVFSFYEDTIDWIEDHLREVLERDERLACYFGKMASAAGHESRNGISREEAVWGFAPESSGAPPTERADVYDLLLCTDVLAEGMNLQQCRNIINYDLPWNPMRLVQRHGRIDRIGSKHPKVFLRTFFPDRALDRLLNLEERVRRKLAQAARSVGVEAAPIEAGLEGQQSFSETRDEIERLFHGDETIFEAGGTVSAAQTGEEYRQELRQALAARGDEIQSLPWKAGSGMVKGRERGHFFCARIDDRVYLRFVPFGGTGEPAEIVSEIGTCLRLVECTADTELVMPLDLKQTAYGAWERARQHVFDEWSYQTDPANLHPRVSRFNRELAAFLRDHAAGIEQSRLERCLDAIEAPISKREENLLRGAFAETYRSRAEKGKALVEEIERIGLEPFQAPDPLPPIDPADVRLVCWMAVEAGGGVA